MIFTSLEYLLFLPLVVVLYWRLTGGARLFLVVLSSFFFYMSWLPCYGVLLLVMTLVNWLLGLGIERSRGKSSITQDQSPDNQAIATGLGATFLNASAGKEKESGPGGTIGAKFYLILGLVANLGALCYYKYIGFFFDSIARATHLVQSGFLSLGVAVPAWDAPVIDVLLPLGISFFVFEFVHYLVDVYKGGRPLTSFSEFAAFAAFFPSQIAGPIKRYQDFVERLRSPEPLTRVLFAEAMGLIVRGFFKKVAIADPFGAVVYQAFASTSIISTTDALIASIGFVIQVYCDFSGYTDIGRGSALLMGIRLPENFALPYMACDLAEFWRRWHISLSTWLRDYCYIPLGGSRDGTFGTWKNLFVTMFLCGLWHGASWHYVIFGCLQGLGLITQREWQRFVESSESLKRFFKPAVFNLLGWFLTMSFMTLVLVVFRAPDMPGAMLIFKSFFNFTGSTDLLVPLVKSGVLAFLSVYFLFWRAEKLVCEVPSLARYLDEKRGSFAWPFRVASWAAAVVLMIAARPTEAVPFVYFQF